MELAGDETLNKQGTKRSIDQVDVAAEMDDQKRKAEQEQEATAGEETTTEAGDSSSTDNPLLNLKFSASQNILDDVPRQKHAKILSPELVSVHTFPDLPDYNPDEVFLLYPSKDAKNIEDIDVSKMKKLVVIDSTWQKAKTILRDERVSKLPCVKINSQKTLFWRYQTVGENCLATIEAIYYFYREYYQKQLGTYDGQYDDLLFFYTYMYNLIQSTYKQQNKKFKRIDGWLKE